MARIRVVSNGGQSGSRIRKFNGSVETRTTTAGNSTCTDFLGRGTDHPLTIEHRDLRYPEISGDVGSFLSGYIYSGYPVTNSGVSLTSYPLPGTIEPDDVYAATKVAGDTNPSRPEVSVPLFLFEVIRELPKMVADRGTDLILGKPGRRQKNTSGQDSVLSFNFGWEQLYRDVAALFDFAEHAEERTKELHAYYSKQGLKRNRTVWTDVQKSIGSNTTLQSQGGNVVGQCHTTVSRKKWVSCRWKPSSDHNLPSAADQVQNARALVHGWKIAPADVWNALPFSWLADYFGNIGDYLAATRNSSEFRLDSCCVMLKTEAKHNMKIVSHSAGMTVTQATSTYALLGRKLGSIGLTANVPVIGARRLLNLLALAKNYDAGKIW